MASAPGVKAAKNAGLEDRKKADAGGDQTHYTTFLAPCPQQLEVDTVALIMALHARHSSLHLHIVRLFTRSMLPLVRQGVRSAAHRRDVLSLPDAKYVLVGRSGLKCCPQTQDSASRGWTTR